MVFEAFFLQPFLLSGRSGGFKFGVSFFENLLVSAVELVFGSDEADGAVQPLFVVVADIFCDLLASLLKTKRNLGADAFAFDGLVIALEFAVALRIKRRRAHMRHAGQANEFLEVLGDKLRSVVGDDPGGGLREFLPGSLQDDLHVFFVHRLAQLPVHDVAAASIKDATQITKRAAQIDVGDIDMPVLMDSERLNKARAFLGGFGVPAAQQLGLAQDTINAAGAHCNHVMVEHHERQPPIALQRVFEIKIDNRLVLPALKPEVSRNQGVVLVEFAVALQPVCNTCSAQSQASR